MREYRALIGPLIVVALIAVAVVWSPFEPHPPPALDPDLMDGADQETGALTPSWSDEDWKTLEARARWALDARVDTLPLGAAVAAIGRSFVGTAYVPQTLEVEGPERVVINFRGLDCVTFVENAFAMAKLVRELASPDGEGAAAPSADGALADRARIEDRYEALIEELRYRDGALDGYPSRLHYFTDWIGDNARRGHLEDITQSLGGVFDEQPIEFMTTHPDAYRQLADPGFVEEIRGHERRLSERGRWYLPEDRIAAVADRIREGDIIAATSTVFGLDVAHTGLALRVDGRLHLLHAPLVGDSVQISEVPLAGRILGIGGQDGIIVARPLDEPGRASSATRGR